MLTVLRLFVRDEAGAGKHRQRRIARESRIRRGQPAQIEGRAARALDELHVRAAAAQSGRRRRWGLPLRRTIVHDAFMFSSEATTRGVRVAVRSEYAPDRSRPSRKEWFFIYTVTIVNEGAEPVQLVTRH